MGLTFAAGVGVVGLIRGLVGLLLEEVSWDDLGMVARPRHPVPGVTLSESRVVRNRLPVRSIARLRPVS